MSQDLHIGRRYITSFGSNTCLLMSEYFTKEEIGNLENYWGEEGLRFERKDLPEMFRMFRGALEKLEDAPRVEEDYETPTELNQELARTSIRDTIELLVEELKKVGITDG
ncbi:hypothetical protein COU61_02495 [Candidatus Pacearchaeota archaeon CG10_big_fil_rev_8_21_14_0_10_35_13]|nr:MAG: hypothetical protein COU61_02495 [Candidatus Pacearchaeota archaeon CG10_big_fil_rev_8_21_14_0_10_35_13]